MNTPKKRMVKMTDKEFKRMITRMLKEMQQNITAEQNQKNKA